MAIIGSPSSLLFFFLFFIFFFSLSLFFFFYFTIPMSKIYTRGLGGSVVFMMVGVGAHPAPPPKFDPRGGGGTMPRKGRSHE